MEPVRSRSFINLPVRHYSVCLIRLPLGGDRSIWHRESVYDPTKRLAYMGSQSSCIRVIRPTVELVDTISRTKHIGIVNFERYDYVQFLYDEIGRMYHISSDEAKLAHEFLWWRMSLILGSGLFREKAYRPSIIRRSANRYAYLGMYSLSFDAIRSVLFFFQRASLYSRKASMP